MLRKETVARRSDPIEGPERKDLHRDRAPTPVSASKRLANWSGRVDMSYWPAGEPMQPKRQRGASAD